MERNLGDKTNPRLSTNSGPTDQPHQQQKRLPSSSLEIEVKLGWDQANRQSVALKTFRIEPSTFRDHPPSSRLLKYEIKSMDRVTPHHNIVRLLKVVVRSPSNVCLVMEAAAASRGDLMQTIAAAPEGRLRPDTARFYLGQLLDAVQHCHSKGVCHRDIQPHNLLVDKRSGNIKLSGFGRAGVWDTTAGDTTDLEFGSNAALLPQDAPEVVKGYRYCGKAADCWSVGATLFTMLAGFSPFTADHAKVGAYGRYFQPSPWVCPLACSLVEGLLEPDAEKRFTIAEVRAHPWFVQVRCSNGNSRGSSASSSTTNASSDASSSSDDGE